jgi:hypothetical protein
MIMSMEQDILCDCDDRSDVELMRPCSRCCCLMRLMQKSDDISTSDVNALKVLRFSSAMGVASSV